MKRLITKLEAIKKEFWDNQEIFNHNKKDNENIERQLEFDNEFELRLFDFVTNNFGCTSNRLQILSELKSWIYDEFLITVDGFDITEPMEFLSYIKTKYNAYVIFNY
jgi:hypothetical protein